MESINQRLRQLCSQRKENKSAIARATGISPQRLNDILSGRRPLSMKLVVPICRALACDPNDLFGWESESGILSSRISKISVMERDTERRIAVVTDEEITTADESIVVILTPTTDQCSLSLGGQGSLP